MSLSWTQPICISCWVIKNPGRRASRLIDSDSEICAYCGFITESGIYVRDDPANVKFPREKAG